jgi:hypothetical protein
MAFHSLPQVDEASRYDDRANSLLILHFSKECGFIARAQSKDMGCDYKVELIEKNGATNWPFDIQLKTVVSPRFISGGQFLSFSIKTSRLGYLVRNAPIYGLLVVYDVSTGTFYFDLVDELYSRLMSERESEDWKANDEVSIHVPCSNKLNAETLNVLHDKFLRRFKNLAAMNRDHGSSYGLYALETSGPINIDDIQGLDDAVEELRANGAMQMMQLDMRRVYDLLEMLPRNKIIADKELLLIALLAYCEVGRIADSMYYIDRVSRRYELNESEHRMVSFISLKNELFLGAIDKAKFVEIAQLLLPGAGLFEELSVRLNI